MPFAVISRISAYTRDSTFTMLFTSRKKVEKTTYGEYETHLQTHRTLQMQGDGVVIECYNRRARIS